MRNPDSWEGWWWGAKHVWGCSRWASRCRRSNIIYDISKNAELLLFWGCDQETTTWGWQGQLPSRLSYWWTELGIKQIYIAPDCNYANAVHADKWIPVRPNTDAALYLAIAYGWFENGTYDKEYLETHAVRRRQVRGLRHGRAEDGQPKTPGVGLADHRRARPDHQGPGRGVGVEAHDHRHRQRRSGHPRRPTPPSRPVCRCCAWPCRAWASPGCNQSKMIEWGLTNDKEQMSPPAPSVMTQPP